MLEGIPLGITDLGTGGLLVLAIAIPVIMLYRRKLVPEKDLLDEREEKNYWRAAYEVSEKARQVSDAQVGDLIPAVAKSNELGELTVAMLRAMRDRAQT